MSITPSPCTEEHSAAPPLRLIPIQRVADIMGLKESSIHAKVQDGTLPRPIKFGTSRRAAARWIEQEILAVVQALADQRQPVTAPAAASRSGIAVHATAAG